jgi:ubiquinone/menaquinone biosynthesis C-methylase UbiE
MKQSPYDRIAADYDTHWSVHVAQPQAKLTEQLNLSRGLRCADLGCGTGVDTIEMLRRVTPGEVLAVDPSAAMLETAAQRARAAGLELPIRCQSAEQFAQASEEHSFDVISLRFTLGYLDWRTVLPVLPRLLRPGGRVGILTILASSAPQAHETYREMVRDLGLLDVSLTAVPSIAEILERLELGGATQEMAWTRRLRLTFPSGEQLAHFLRESGIATHPALSALPDGVAQALWRNFAERIEVYREADGVPLDFELGGLVARRTLQDELGSR